MTAFVRGVIARARSSAVDVERRGIDIHQHGPGADARDAAGGGEERIGRGDDFVAGTDVERHQRREERVGAGRHADRVRHAEPCGELAFERLDFGAEDEALAVAHARDGREHFVAKRRVLRGEIEKRHVHGLTTTAGTDGWELQAGRRMLPAWAAISGAR